MNSASTDPAVRARKIESVVFQALSNTPASTIAVAMGVSEPTISRLKNEHLGPFARMLAHLGLKIVPVAVHCYDPAYIEAVQTLAGFELRRRKFEKEPPPELDFD